MDHKPKTIIVTGGAGFIGSALVRHLMTCTEYRVINVDALTYAADRQGAVVAARDPRCFFVEADITDRATMRALFERYQPDGVIHLAAESHVDRSIDAPGQFIQTNVLGTYELLDCAREYWMALDAARSGTFRFHHVSTDEVFGSLDEHGHFNESTRYAPNSPYSASKAASDHLVRAWHHTYGLPVVITNCSNNYGPYQFPEKLIPLMIRNAALGRKLPVYGTGSNIRDWLYVDDHARALLRVFEAGRVGETYVIGGANEVRNLELVESICSTLDAIAPDANLPDRTRLIEFVEDRKGHDFRYAIDASKIRNELGWQPRETLESGLRKTIEWYLANEAWVASIQARGYDGQRLGLAGAH